MGTGEDQPQGWLSLRVFEGITPELFISTALLKVQIQDQSTDGLSIPHSLTGPSIYMDGQAELH